jgi:hypothetical protein
MGVLCVDKPPELSGDDQERVRDAVRFALMCALEQMLRQQM